VAQPIQDDGFREIQLNGKQLVFLFMAATVVSVVIFLCGVLVGRGVRAERGGVADVAAMSTSADSSPLQTPPPAAAAAPAAGSDPTKAAAPPPADDLTYFDRLEKSKAAEEKLKPADKAAPAPATASNAPAAKPAPPPPSVPAAKSAPTPAPAPAPAVKDTPRAAAPETAPEPSGQGFAVQIAALNVRSEAEAIARRLSSKGYAAYVLSPANGTPSVYRVRVGKFGTRREAETIAAKLQKEEQFKPWVTR
jgi:cell division septation protein DedD